MVTAHGNREIAQSKAAANVERLMQKTDHKAHRLGEFRK